jgi:hypothetical protein
MMEAARFKVEKVEDNPAYEFVSDSALGAALKYGVKSVSVRATRVRLFEMAAFPKSSGRAVPRVQIGNLWRWKWTPCTSERR